MKSMRLRICAILFVGLFVLYACEKQTSTSIRIGLASMPISLDPRYATDAASSHINRLLYQRLVEFDENSRPIPGIATWEMRSPTRYRFTLGDKGRIFHDQTLLTATDVKSTYDYILDSDNNSPHRLTLSMITDIVVIDDNRIDFVIRSPDPLFPGYLSFGITPARLNAIAKRLDRNPLGSGMFKLGQWQSGSKLVLERVHDQQIMEFVHVSDPTVRVLKLMKGEIDIIQNDIPKELVKYLEKQDQVQVSHRIGSNYSYLGFNFLDEQLKNIKVRTAIALSIDREKIVKYLFGGKTRVAHGIFPPEHWVGESVKRWNPKNVELAKQLLSELGYSESYPLKLTYKTSSDPFRIRIATILQYQLRLVGIEVRIQSYDWATFYQDIKDGDFQLYSLTWVGLKSPDVFRYIFHSESTPPMGANRGRFQDTVLDRYIERAEKEQNLQHRDQLYAMIQQYILKTLPYVPLWYEEHILVTRKNIDNYTLSSDGNYDGLIYAVSTKNQSLK